MLQVTRCNVARGDDLYKNTSCKPLPGNTEMESRSNFENYELIIYEDVYYIALHYNALLILFVKMC